VPRPRSRLPGPHARKALGQHFLRDSGILADIVAAVHQPEGGLVLEIGAGTGQLTEALLEAGNNVLALEIEERMLRHLHQRFAGNANLRLAQADARDVDVAELIPPGMPFVVVGNLPYFAANPIIRHFLEAQPKPLAAIFMVQREVARELAAKPGHFSLLSISVQVYAEATSLFDVPPLAFDPPPAVYSSVVRLAIREQPLVPPERIEAFFTLVSKTFRNPRKQIHNALVRETGLTVDEADQVLAETSIDPMRRAETLSIPEWLALLDAVERVRAW
jgi:16S rRNA (adenine1518-N6/adenine1519-N6)-dimethyltransferase